ncbi:cation:proton antiporter [Lactiplantibacillus mudanjiangensis]|uniref:Na(+)/H(+) antiporter [Lactobacillus plantarum JDM1] n=1 Tax=Lactiplantibacillus mudanjiangensis TaxID=1296538 RepID=A0A660E0J4_9LACO|nr:sodium:proton antiporter [Lactiplantibacillus mudanjiangensis]VDG18958.1 Na(+)/H(+) antiporter [Lactobacillus plantarum JDM1] [Lactiplantibacillus mudanjiangensis]VDG25265.1 Na(+)/H(+) antiporter [Lactobacillus plantarum JDM1] [Lactiplantibacillus mudanjiangensis]VDG27481.1 Na(+)/H(+) antiporter [Lactobacillus plantarum JDM1] [Lactiplantibacillus mudanjiangensis]VDG33058.1 Na(+)/H(+) antiporter [Lactobacillus plantarum JDM1] [Lactiplantibacillus mudanjiangensis]
MDTVFLVLLLIAAVIGANAVYARFKLVPVAFLQIAAGLVLSLTPLYRNFELEPEIFLLVIISVLMFNDGQNTNIRKLSHQLGTTMSLAVVLAIVTILIVGTVTHFLIPAFSLALSLALGAIITPTDAVAVSSITTKVSVPKAVMSTLENESLFNDASGIVAFNLAIAAITTGQFSVWHGITNFLYVFVGGILVGLLLGYIIVAMRINLINAQVDTPSVIVPYTLLTPFVVYLIAESLGVSGILAVVATGLIHGVQQERLRLTTSRLQIVMSTTWSIVASILNGIVFVLLGVSLPSVISHLQQRDTGSVAILIGLGVLLYALMTVIRFLWLQFDFAKLRAWDHHEKAKNSWLIALSGVHGTITLAMAFSLPLTLNHQAFMYRNDLIFVAAVVILTSLLVPTLVLPLILPAKVDQVTETDLAKAKVEMVTSAIHMIQARYGESPSASKVIMILEGQRNLDGRPDRAQLNQLFDQAYNIEETTVEQMLANGEVTLPVAQKYLRVASQTRLQNQQSFWQRFRLFIKFVIIGKFFWSKQSRARRRAHQKARQKGLDRKQLKARNREFWSQMRAIEQKPYQAIVTWLNDSYTVDNHQAIGIVRRAYDQRHQRLSGTRDLQDAQNELLIQAFQLEYNFVQAQTAQQKYDRALSNALYEQISTDQLVYLQSVNVE